MSNKICCFCGGPINGNFYIDYGNKYLCKNCMTYVYTKMDKILKIPIMGICESLPIKTGGDDV